MTLRNRKLCFSVADGDLELCGQLSFLSLALLALLLSVCGDLFLLYPKERGAQAPLLDLPRISVKLKKWKFGRMRNAAGT